MRWIVFITALSLLAPSISLTHAGCPDVFEASDFYGLPGLGGVKISEHRSLVKRVQEFLAEKGEKLELSQSQVELTNLLNHTRNTRFSADVILAPKAIIAAFIIASNIVALADISAREVFTGADAIFSVFSFCSIGLAIAYGLGAIRACGVTHRTESLSRTYVDARLEEFVNEQYLSIQALPEKILAQARGFRRGFVRAGIGMNEELSEKRLSVFAFNAWMTLSSRGAEVMEEYTQTEVGLIWMSQYLKRHVQIAQFFEQTGLMTSSENQDLSRPTLEMAIGFAQEGSD